MTESANRPGIPVKREGVEVIAFDEANAERARCEAEVVASGWPLPLQHRIAWDRASGEASIFFAARKPGEGWSYAAVMRSTRTRSLPGHLLSRVERLVPARDPRLSEGLLEHMVAVARETPRCLRLNVGVFSRDASAREGLGRVFEAKGFARPASLRSYRHTLSLDLTPDETELFASFNRLTRRSCRKLEKLPLEIRRIEGDRYDDRMGVLHAETMARTGGSVEEPDWPMIRSLSEADPSLSNLVGLFRSGDESPDALLALLWGVHHGDHVCYDVGASTRETEFNLPLSYGLMWHLMLWARSEGASWFDLGGVTLENPDAEDPLAGISDFKRGFSKQLAEVGDEWQLEVRPLRSRLLELVSGSLGRLRS